MSDIVCLPCKHLSKDVKAAVWCLSCDEALCEQCCNYHKILKVTKDHTPIKIEDYQPIADFLSVLPTTCKQHPEQQIKYRCPVHDSVFCLLCNGDHLTCKDIREIGDGLLQLDAYSRLQVYSNDLEEKISTMKMFCDRSKSTIEMLDTQHTKFIHDISKIRKDIDASFHKLQMELEKNLDSTLEFEKRKLEHDCKTYKEFQAEWQKFNQQLLKIIQLRPLSNIQLFLAWRHVLLRNEMDQDQLKEIITNMFESSLDLKIDVDITKESHNIDITDKIQITRTFKPAFKTKDCSLQSIYEDSNWANIIGSSGIEYENTTPDQSETLSHFTCINKQSDDHEYDAGERELKQTASQVSKTEDARTTLIGNTRDERESCSSNTEY